VVDSSASINQKSSSETEIEVERFRSIVMPFVHKFAGLFNIGANETQIGLILFGTDPHEEFKLNQYTDKEALLKAIDEVKYMVRYSGFLREWGFYVWETKYTLKIDNCDPILGKTMDRVCFLL
jgi:hypothetical protein